MVLRSFSEHDLFNMMVASLDNSLSPSRVIDPNVDPHESFEGELTEVGVGVRAMIRVRVGVRISGRGMVRVRIRSHLRQD